jgi:hypothetical protein
VLGAATTSYLSRKEFFIAYLVRARLLFSSTDSSAGEERVNTFGKVMKENLRT